VNLEPATWNVIDIHVHLLGNGLSGSGCRIKRAWWQAPFLWAMAQGIGLDCKAESSQLDAAYRQVLVNWIDQSSLGGAVVLACDYVHLETGVPQPDLTRLYVPNDYVLSVAASHPRLLPGVSIHPARPDALDALEQAVESGAVLLKLLPCVQLIDPSRASYRWFWQRMADLGLPLLAHTGGEFSLPTLQRDLQDPNCLREPLELGVTVIAAHCGAPALPWDHDYSPAFFRLRDRYENLYGDISALSQPVHLRTLARVRAEPERILYGSDYPVLTALSPARWAGWLPASDYSELRLIRNPLEKKLRLSRALGFPEELFTGARDVLRLGDLRNTS
jgi:uncharacterized protein